MPSTSNALESALLRSRSAYGSASHGISPKYSAKLFSSRSLLTKMSSRSRPFSLYALYASASFGVKPRHGGHQCAEKYSSRCFDARSATGTLAPLVSASSTSPPPRSSESGLGFHGNAAPVGSSETAERPSVVMTEPSASRITSVGMPRTLNFFESLSLRSRSAYGSASHGCSWKYSSKACSSRSELTKTTSKLRPFSLYAVYVSASFGVKPRQGGHQ